VDTLDSIDGQHLEDRGGAGAAAEFAEHQFRVGKTELDEPVRTIPTTRGYSC
jgi:hypothetical protein